jgi:hypothetical protein
MWAGPQALDETTQEMHIAATQFTDDEYLAAMAVAMPLR